MLIEHLKDMATFLFKGIKKSDLELYCQSPGCNDPKIRPNERVHVCYGDIVHGNVKCVLPHWAESEKAGKEQIFDRLTVSYRKAQKLAKEGKVNYRRKDKV